MMMSPATQTRYRIMMMLLLLTACHRLQGIHGFVPRPQTKKSISSSSQLMRHNLANVNVAQPSSDAATAQGIREWPQQTKKGTWLEDCEDGELLTRYVLEGTGTVEIAEDDNTKSYQLSPGTLVEVEGKAALSWTVASSEMILLTPGFEQGGIFAAVAVLVLILFGSLIALS